MSWAQTCVYYATDLHAYAHYVFSWLPTLAQNTLGRLDDVCLRP